MTQHPEEGTLHAYIDGELSPVEAASLEAHVAGCESCAASLAEARGLVAAAARAIAALDVAPSSPRSAPSTRTAAVPIRRTIRAPIFRPSYARAAALLLLVGGTAVVVDRSGTLEREATPRAELVTADAPTTTQVAPTAAPEAASAAAPANTSTRSAGRDVAPSSDGRAARAVTRKAVAATGGAAGVAADAATGRVESAATLSAPAPLAGGQDVSFANSRRRLAPPGDTIGRPSVAAVAPASPPAARPAEMRLSEVVVTGVSGTPARVTRYRTKEGTILTLTEEQSRTSFGEGTASERRTASQSAPQRAAPQTTAGMAAPVVNSYRWTSAEQGRTYTLTGPLTVVELEALSKRLGELERLP